MEENKMNNEEFLKSIEKAAEKGAKKGNLKSSLISSLPTIIVLIIIAVIIIPKIMTLSEGFKNFFKVDEPVEGHDMTIENTGIFGYKTADFEEAILGDSEKLTKLEVYKQEVDDAVTQTDTGLFNLSVFTKTQIITYHGEVVYTVDLSGIKKSDIKYDEEQKIVTLKIPHAKQEEINIPESEIQFGDVNKGLLAFGEIELTSEQVYEIQAGVREKMQLKLDEENALETADRFAKLAVWEMYSPIIKGVGKDVSLEVEFR